MKYIFYSVLIVILMINVLVQNVSASQTETDHASWWIKTYGVLDPKHPLIPRVHEVFRRVNAAADKQSKHFPKLVILKSAGKHNAVCLPDGSILLTQKALTACYTNENMSEGDSKMAFIIAHELAHLSNGDFWQPPNESPHESPSDNNEYPPSMKDLFHHLEDNHIKEFHADDFAIIYMTMAGYDPGVIVQTAENNFFQEWVAHCEANPSQKSDSHPPPNQRAKMIVLRINDIIDSMKAFEIGIRLYQLGKYKDALVFLEFFCEKFPSREVYNNLGLIYYQLGMKELAECDPEAAYRFKLSTFIDPETRAEKMRIPLTQNDQTQKRQMNKKSGCRTDLFHQAIGYLIKACEKDPFYVPAFVNYSSALIMSGQYSKAVGILRDDALKLDKHSPDALNNFAVALYLIGPDPYINVDMFRDASTLLKNVITSNPGFADPYFNLGRIQDERNRYAASRQSWENFLTLEPSGVYANAVSSSSKNRKNAKTYKNIPFDDKIPVKFGEIDQTTLDQLKAFDKHVLKIGAVYCELYTYNGIKALALDDVIEVVETPLKKKLNSDALHAAYGDPLMTFDSLSGNKTLLFKKFAVDIRDGIVNRVIHFESKKFGFSNG